MTSTPASAAGTIPKYESADAVSVPFVNTPLDAAVDRPTAPTIPYVPETKSMPPLPRDGSFDRRRTTIAAVKVDLPWSM